MYVVSFEDKIHVNDETLTRSEEPEASEKVEKQSNYHFIHDSLLRDDSDQSKMTAHVDGKHPRIGISLPGLKAEVQDLQSEKKSENQNSLETKAGSFSMGNSQSFSPSVWEGRRQGTLPSIEVLANNSLCHMDRGQALRQKTLECFDSKAFLRVAREVAKTSGENHLKQSESVRVPNFLQPAAQASMDAVLVDVDVDVQASYQGEHVPLVSLMSRLNGKAIVGHPVTVETLEDGCSDVFLAENGFLSDSIENFQAYDVDKVESGALQPVWRTARRTAMQRTPRSCSSVENEDSNPSQYSGCENRQPLVKTVYAGLLNHKIRFIRRNLSHKRRPSLDKKLPKKFLKRVGLSSQKTRTLSSIAVEHKYKNGPSGLAHPLKMAEVPLVSCIPVKLMFSRIKEAVGSTSKSGSRGLSSTSSAGEKQL
eukprot:Gb_13674 [translate_table: standard]